MNRTSLCTGLIFSALAAVLPGCDEGDSKCKDGSDSDNCGACETACLDGETCIEGACVVTCAAPSKTCGGQCIDVQTSVANCGTCGNACAPYGECTAGKCENPLALLQTELLSQPESGLGVGGGSDRDLFLLEDGSLELIKVNGPALPAGGVVDHAILPNGDVLMVAAQDTDGVTELYRVSARGGARTKLSAAMVDGGDVQEGLAISADGSRVLYRADQEVDDVINLYAVDLAKPGVAVKVNGDLVEFGSVSSDGMALSADGKRAVYIANQEQSETNEPYTVDLSAAAPGASVKLGEGGRSVDFLRMSANGKRVVFRSYDNGDKLFVIDTATPGVSHMLENSDGGEGNVQGYDLAADGSAVVYTSSPFSEESLWWAPLAGATAYESVRLVDGELDGRVQRDVKLSADGTRVYFRKRDSFNGETDTRIERLFYVDVARPRQLTRLTPSTDSFSVFVDDFALSRDGKSLAFRSNVPSFGSDGLAGRLPGGRAFELRHIDLSKATPGAPVLLTTEIAGGHDGIGGGYLVTNDRRVLFPADYEEARVTDVYLVAADKPGVLRKVSPARAQTSDAAAVSAMSLF